MNAPGGALSKEAQKINVAGSRACIARAGHTKAHSRQWRSERPLYDILQGLDAFRDCNNELVSCRFNMFQCGVL